MPYFGAVLNLPTFHAWREATATGDTRLENTLVTKLLKAEAPFVKGVVRKFARDGVDPQELAQAARTGVLRALRGFNPEKGSWPHYRLQWALSEIRSVVQGEALVTTVARSSILPLPKAARKKAKQIWATTGVEATAEQLGVSEARLAASQVNANAAGGWKYNKEGSFAFASEMSDDNKGYVEVTEFETEEVDLPNKTLSRGVFRVLAVLTPIERRVILGRTLEDKFPSEIAKDEGISEATVRRIYEDGISKLRSAVKTG